MTEIPEHLRKRAEEAKAKAAAKKVTPIAGSRPAKRAAKAAAEADTAKTG